MERQQAAAAPAAKKKRKKPSAPDPATAKKPADGLDRDLLGAHQPIETSTDALTFSTTPGQEQTRSVTITAKRRCRLRLRVRGDDFAIASPAPAAGVKLDAGEELVAQIRFSPRAMGSVRGSLELVSTAAGAAALTLDSRSRVALEGVVTEAPARREKPAPEPGRRPAAPTLRPRAAAKDESTEPSDKHAPNESPKIPEFTYMVLSAKAKAPEGELAPLGGLVYIRDRIHLQLLPSGSEGPLELDGDGAVGLSILEESPSLHGAVRLTLRAEIAGSYKIQFRRGRSHFKGEPINVEVLPEARRPRSSVLGPTEGTRSNEPPAPLSPEKPSQQRCDNEINPDDPSCFLTAEQRSELKGEAKDRIRSAAERFADATEVVKDEISAKLSVERAFWRTVFELAFGLGVGRIAQLIGSGLARLPTDLDERVRETAAAVLGKPELVKGPLMVATKRAVRVGVNAYTPGPKALFTRLRHLSHQAAQEACGRVKGFTDPELIAAVGLWDLNNCTEADYVLAIRSIVSRWSGQVEPIGAPRALSDRSLGTGRVVWVQEGRLRRLALAVQVEPDRVRGGDSERDEYENSRATDQGEVVRRRPASKGYRQGGPQPTERWHFETWVDPDMQDMAIARGGGEGAIQDVDARQFHNRGAFDVE
jgi:hypothetical protein